MSVQPSNPSQKITPFLWFDNNVEEAVNFYTSIFPNSKIINSFRKSDNEPLHSATFEIDGLRLIAFNGGPHFKFSEAISLMVSCDTQEEIDEKWEKLSAGGQESRCGWLKDKFGLSWQVATPVLPELLNDKDPKKVQRVMQAMFKMSKLDIAGLRKAYEQEEEEK